MGRTKKNVEVPGQEKSSQAEEAQLLNSVVGNARADDQTVQQRVGELLDDAVLSERNAILATINEQGGAIIGRFEEYGFTDANDHPLTNCIEFLQLVKKATTAAPAAPLGYVTNDEGKPQPVAGKPVLTEHGWHVPG
ncbi:hypothetical protein CJD89_001667 [Salmonella enterica subsp. enterica serovar Saintpaul]|nr:hypothetical protein [Salmonella enterica]EDQ5102800.1 hypothetical protein [Salmonella enterica subsp. enterica serovar Saintpaul]EBC2149045.1 hypothetical protein [Salmonella enterica]EBD4895400.1 hypothetical protein [Salmonella enterica]EBN1303562.1 hypothetical protein [Salmonella enterica]